MTPQQAAVNSRALIAAADKLTRAGYDGDAYRFCESLVVSVLADGYRVIEKPPPLQGSTSTEAARRAAIEAAEAAVRAARDKRLAAAKEGK